MNRPVDQAATRPSPDHLASYVTGVIATLVAREPGPCEIVSSDRDLIALASERVRVLYVGRGVAKLEDLGSYHRTLTGSWRQGNQRGDFKLTRD